MQQFSWPVLALALVTLIAGAVVGDALRAVGSGGGADGSVYVASSVKR